jgi:hypothetical protein
MKSVRTMTITITPAAAMSVQNHGGAAISKWFELELSETSVVSLYVSVSATWLMQKWVSLEVMGKGKVTATVLRLFWL